ncbi:MAG: DNA polymerase III subunit delta [Aristaeellaceae bacterium]
MDRKELMQAIKDNRVQGAYLLEGVEENIKAAALTALRKAMLPEGLEELNETILDNPATDAIIAAAETLPFMADRRLVTVREHPALTGRAEAEDRLCEYVRHVPDSCALIFLCRGKADARKKLYKAVQKAGHVVSFNPLTEGELNSWIRKSFQALGKACTPETASLLAFTVGTDTALLRTEMEKLAALAGDSGEVTDTHIRAVATRSLECTVFEMVDAVVAGQEGRAFGLLRDMLLTGSDRLGILAMLLRQYRLLQHVKIMQYEKLNPQQIKQGLGIAPFAAERCIRQAAAYSGGEVRQAVDICLDTEYQVKSGRMNQEGALEAAMLRIFALRHARQAR